MHKGLLSTLSLVTILTLSACNSKDGETPEINGNDSVGVCRGVQSSSNSETIEILATCKDLDGIMIDSLKVTIDGKVYDLTSIKESNIVRDSEGKIIEIKDWQIITGLPTSYKGQAQVSMQSINGETQEYEITTSELFNVGLTTATPAPAPAPAPAPETPPVIGALQDKVLNNGQSLSYVLPITATDGDTFTVSVQDLPSGFSYNSSTNTITGSSTTEGTTVVTVDATDNDGTTTKTFTIEVKAVVTAPNTPPKAIDGSVDGGSASSKTFSMANVISDTEDVDSALTIEITTPPAGGTLNISGTSATYNMSSGNAGDDYFYFKVIDSEGLESDIKKYDLILFDNA